MFCYVVEFDVYGESEVEAVYLNENDARDFVVKNIGRYENHYITKFNLMTGCADHLVCQYSMGKDARIKIIELGPDGKETETHHQQ